MLFKSATLAGLKSGRISLAFRRWDAPRAKVGGQQKTRIGVLAFASVEPIAADKIIDKDAHAAGFTSREQLLNELNQRGQGIIYRIEMKLIGPDPRIALRNASKLSLIERDEISRRLDRLDRASATGPWTHAFLALVARRPATRAVLLAKSIGWERAPFKLNVRKLKALGLTESLEIGYRLSPRGRAFLKSVRPRPTARSSRRQRAN